MGRKGAQSLFSVKKIGYGLKSKMPCAEDTDTRILYGFHVMQITVLRETLTLYWL